MSCTEWSGNGLRRGLLQKETIFFETNKVYDEWITNLEVPRTCLARSWPAPDFKRLAHVTDGES